MNTVAVVPMNSLSRAKSRLAGVLSPGERASLARDMLSHVLDALTQSGAVSQVAVISPEPPELGLPPGIAPLKQERPALNDLLEQGREWAERQKVDALLVIFADLPLLSPGDVKQLVSLGTEDNTVVLAPDRHSLGTNAMLANPVSLARFAFGPRSLARHIALYSQSSIAVRTFASKGTSLDIDTPDDLSYLNAEVRGHVYSFHDAQSARSIE